MSRSLRRAARRARPSRASTVTSCRWAFAASLPPGSEDAGQLKAFKERVGAEARGILNEAERRIADAGVEVACHVIWQEPTAALIEAADNTGASMIVVGAHGESALGGMLRGSVAYDLLHHSSVPVLVVPHRTAAAA
jgi:nucleotide-binding universal stress UspA family protein